MTRIKFIAEKGNKGADNVRILLEGLEDLPKVVPVTSEDFMTNISTGKAYVENGVLMIEAELKETDFNLSPVIGFESIEEEEDLEGVIVIKRSILHNVSLQTIPNVDPEILSISGQLNSGEALLMYY